jgi:hypothetical protein
MMERLRKKWPWVSKRRAAERERAAVDAVMAQGRELMALLVDERKLRQKAQPMATFGWSGSPPAT